VKTKALTFCCAIALTSFFSVSLKAQEGFLNVGSTKDDETYEKSFFWSIEYMQDLRENCAFGFSWLNEGHLENHNIHHRDGQSLQIWAKEDIIDNKFSLLAGIGPYLYSDTTRVIQDRNYQDNHGLGIEYSLAGIWHLKNPWIVKAQGNYIDTFDNFDTISFSLGLGYMFGSSFPEEGNTADKEITVFLGQTIVNSFDSEKNMAKSVEYRQGLSRYLDWSVAWIDEGDADLINRRGGATQLWLTRSFFEESLTGGFGGGAYVFEDKEKDSDGSEIGLVGLVSVSGSYRLSEKWLTRVSWSRVVSDYDRDTDIILFGLGYRF
jgi:hypothetical protein